MWHERDTCIPLPALRGLALLDQLYPKFPKRHPQTRHLRPRNRLQHRSSKISGLETIADETVKTHQGKKFSFFQLKRITTLLTKISLQIRRN